MYLSQPESTILHEIIIYIDIHIAKNHVIKAKTDPELLLHSVIAAGKRFKK